MVKEDLAFLPRPFGFEDTTCALTIEPFTLDWQAENEDLTELLP